MHHNMVRTPTYDSCFPAQRRLATVITAALLVAANFAFALVYLR